MCVGGLQPVQNRRHRHPASKPGRTTGQEGPQGAPSGGATAGVMSSPPAGDQPL